MKIAWSTDIHLDFIDEKKGLQFCHSISQTECDRVFITGDIADSSTVVHWLSFLESQLQRPIYFVLGNHDYYHGSIQRVRTAVGQYCRGSRHLFWLPQSAVVKLKDGVHLIGHGGWGDAKYGNFLQTPVRLNDHRLIDDLTGWDRQTLQSKLQRLGEEAADFLRSQLTRAVLGARIIWVLTHVPPYPESCWHNGEWGAVDWISDFACKSVGDVLMSFADEHPDVQLNVLCGHGHSPGEVFMRQNLHVRTGGAVYGAPAVEAVLQIN